MKKSVLLQFSCGTLMALVLAGCSGSSGSNNNGILSPTDVQTLSVPSYTKQKDLTEQEYTALTRDFYKTCKSFNEYVKPNSVFKKQVNFFDGTGSGSYVTTETITSVMPKETKGAVHYDSIGLSYFAGRILASDWADSSCTMKSGQSFAEKHCKIDTKFSEQFKNYIRQHNGENSSDENCETKDMTVKLRSYETGVSMVDGRQISVVITKEQMTGTESCDKHAVGQVTMTNIMVETNALRSSPDGNCGSAEVYSRWIKQDASNKVISDSALTLLSAPRK